MAKGKYEKWLEKESLIQIAAWARNGLTDEQIAQNMGCSCSTLYEWKNKYPEISESLKKGKEVVDIEVENALLKKAKGYIYEEKVFENGVLVKTVEKVMPPDTTAAIFWLKNRKPEAWRDKQQLEVSQDKPFLVEIKVID